MAAELSVTAQQRTNVLKWVTLILETGLTFPLRSHSFLLFWGTQRQRAFPEFLPASCPDQLARHTVPEEGGLALGEVQDLIPGLKDLTVWYELLLPILK